MVRSNDRGSVGFLADVRRLNVAITRARRHLALVCDAATLECSPFLRGLVAHVRRRGAVLDAAVTLEAAGEGGGEGGGGGPPGLCLEAPAEAGDARVHVRGCT